MLQKAILGWLRSWLRPDAELNAAQYSRRVMRKTAADLAVVALWSCWLTRVLCDPSATHFRQPVWIVIHATVLVLSVFITADKARLNARQSR